MVRKLKHHEQKLLKKVDFLQWSHAPPSSTTSNTNAAEVIRRYHLQSPHHYTLYNKLCGKIRQLAYKISLLDPNKPDDAVFRLSMEKKLIEKIWSMGFITKKGNLSSLEKISVAAICRRRLPIIMVRLKMAVNVRDAVTMVEQGHIRVGPQTVTDPSFLVTRAQEDFVTWVDSSKYKRKIMKYNGRLDDFDLLD